MLLNYMSGPQFDGLDDFNSGNPQFDGLFNSQQSSVYSRETSTNQTYTSGTGGGYIIFTTDSNSLGSVPISTTNNYLFTNTAATTLAFRITCNVSWIADVAGNGAKQQWISKNNSEVNRFGFTSMVSVANHSQATIVSAVVVLAPSEYFGVRVFQNTGHAQSINGSTNEKCKIQITQIK
jgi:hypothetical protein